MNYQTKSLLDNLKQYIGLISKNYFLLIAFAIFNISTVHAEQKLPKYIGYVNDYSSVLNTQELKLLNSLMSSFEDSVGVQIAVLIEESSQPYDVFDRALFVSRGWKIGNKGVNNGILIYLAIKDRKYHIITADKTQGALTDGIVGEIGRKALVPYLKQGDYYSAIRETTYELAFAVKGEFNGRTRKSQKKVNNPLTKILGPIIFLVLFYLLFFRRGGGGGIGRRGVYHSPLFFGGFSGGHSGGGSSFGSGGGFGGFGGGGGFNGGGAGGSW